jgi:CNT family concentrative nucleoside transporter
VAYARLAEHIKAGTLSPKSVMMATYFLCGFANFSSIGIQIGGISALEPSRRADLAKLGFKAMLGGAIVSCLTASIAGILIG